MKKVRMLAAGAMLLMGLAGRGLAAAGDAKPLYEMNFEQAKTGAVPEDFLILDGGFEVKQEEGNKFLELPGAPLDSFGALFGPSEKSDVAVSARIRSTNKGRRYPTFGVGLNGQSGYKLQVSPGKKALEIYKGDTVAASVPYDWKSGEWTMLRLQVVEGGRGLESGGKGLDPGCSGASGGDGVLRGKERAVGWPGVHLGKSVRDDADPI